MTWHSISYEHSPHSTIKAREEIPRFGNLAASSLCLLENLWVLISSQLPLKNRGDDRKQPCRMRCLKEGAQNKVTGRTEATKTQSERRCPLRDAAAPPPTLERSSCWSQSAISEAYLVKLSWWVGPLQSSEVQILHTSQHHEASQQLISERLRQKYLPVALMPIDASRIGCLQEKQTNYHNQTLNCTLLHVISVWIFIKDAGSLFFDNIGSSKDGEEKWENLLWNKDTRNRSTVRSWHYGAFQVAQW